jgi:hypothetical protein
MGAYTLFALGLAAVALRVSWYIWMAEEQKKRKKKAAKKRK